MSDRYRPELCREDFSSALKELGTFVDVRLDDLMQINELAQEHARIRSAEQLMIFDIMTPDVVTVNQQASLREAASMLLEHRISGLPVVDGDRRLAGIVTEADFLRAMGIPCHHPTHTLWQTLESIFMQQPSQGKIASTVSDIMTPEVVTVSVEASLQEAIQTLKRYSIKRLVVLNAERRVVGMVTRSNLVRVLLQQVF